jgi:hypothetical protein
MKKPHCMMLCVSLSVIVSGQINWTPHVITIGFIGSRFACAYDIDRDGDIDILACAPMVMMLPCGETVAIKTYLPLHHPELRLCNLRYCC